MNKQKKNPPAFLRNTYEILQNDHYSSIICWTDNGNGFVIKDQARFESIILPKYFKHGKYTSFVRQLNMYGFHKHRNSNNQNNFQHELFRKGHLELTQIRRKPEKKKKIASMENEEASLQPMKRASELMESEEVSEDKIPQPTMSQHDEMCLRVCQLLLKQNLLLNKNQKQLREMVLNAKQQRIKSVNGCIQAINNIRDSEINPGDKCRSIIDNMSTLEARQIQTISQMSALATRLAQLKRQLVSPLNVFSNTSIQENIKCKMS